MSESVAVNFGANALWQLHRFLQLCLRHRARHRKKLLVQVSQLQLRKVIPEESRDEEGEGRGGDSRPVSMFNDNPSYAS